MPRVSARGRAGEPRFRRSRACRPIRDRICASCARSEDAVLHSYGWVDKNAGIVRIPIERGDEAHGQRGLPARAGEQ